MRARTLAADEASALSRSTLLDGSSEPTWLPCPGLGGRQSSARSEGRGAYPRYKYRRGECWRDRALFGCHNLGLRITICDCREEFPVFFPVTLRPFMPLSRGRR